MDSEEEDLEVLRQAMAEEKVLRGDDEPRTTGVRERPEAPGQGPQQELDLDESTDELREALQQEMTARDNACPS